MVALNNAVEKMTQNDFNCRFMDGTKRKSRKSVEQLKQESDEASKVVEAERKASEIIDKARQSAKTIEDNARAEAARYMAEQREQIRREREAAKKDAQNAAEAVLSVEKQKVKEMGAEAEKRLKTANTASQRVQEKERQLDDQLRAVEQVRQKYQNACDDAELMLRGCGHDVFYKAFRDGLAARLAKKDITVGGRGTNQWAYLGDSISAAIDAAKIDVSNSNLTPAQQFNTRVVDRGTQAEGQFREILAGLQGDTEDGYQY